MIDADPGDLGEREFDFHGELDRTIHQPARLAVVSLLAVVERADFVFLQDRTGLTPGNLGSHMSRLEDAGYVKVEKTFVDRKPRTTYRLTDEGRRAFTRYRKQMDSVLGASS